MDPKSTTILTWTYRLKVNVHSMAQKARFACLLLPLFVIEWLVAFFWSMWIFGCSSLGGHAFVDPNWRSHVSYVGRFDQNDAEGPRFSWQREFGRKSEHIAKAMAEGWYIAHIQC